jgi:hypothetical protein
VLRQPTSLAATGGLESNSPGSLFITSYCVRNGLIEDAVSSD